MLISILIVMAGCMLYFLLKPPSVAPQPKSEMLQEVDAPVSYGYEANLNA